MPDVNVLADYPGVIVFALFEGHDLRFNVDKGYALTCSTPLRIKAFPRDRREYLRSFTIGRDGDDAGKVWAYGNGAMLTSSPRAKEVAFGASLGDIIKIEGQEYRIDPDHNHNIKLVRV